MIGLRTLGSALGTSLNRSPYSRPRDSVAVLVSGPLLSTRATRVGETHAVIYSCSSAITESTLVPAGRQITGRQRKHHQDPPNDRVRDRIGFRTITNCSTSLCLAPRPTRITIS